MALRLLILSIGLIFLHGHLRSILLALDRTSTELRIVALATVVNIVLNCVFIPVWGIAAAAASTVTAEGLILLLVLGVVRSKGGRFYASAVCRPALAAMLMGAVLVGLRMNESLVLSVAVGSVVYAVALFLLRGIPEDIKLYLHGNQLG
jgi:O-antigen/teichoic acid export membrane protein